MRILMLLDRVFPPDPRVKLGQAGAEDIKKRYNWQRSSQQLMEIYRELEARREPS